MLNYCVGEFEYVTHLMGYKSILNVDLNSQLSNLVWYFKNNYI